MTAEPYRQPDYTTWRAALIEYEHVGVYRCRSIHVEATPLLLLRKVAPVVLGCAETLITDFWEYFSVNEEMLQLLFDPDCKCPLFRDCHDWREIVPLLRHMAGVHERGLVDATADESILGEWYQELQSINVVWAEETNPPGNYIHVPLEASLPTFVKQLLAHEARRFDSRLILVQGDEERFQAVRHSKNVWAVDDGGAIELGQLAVLAHAPDSRWRDQAAIRAFWKWVERFNGKTEG